MNELNKINRRKTFKENMVNFLIAATPIAIATLGLHELGLLTVDSLVDNSQALVETFKRGTPALAGVTTAGIKNAFLMIDTLRRLEGKTVEGKHDYYRTEDDGNTLVFRLTCKDKRIKGISGGTAEGATVAGSFGPLAAQVNNFLLADAVANLTPDNPVTDFLVGYFLGGNILTSAYTFFNTWKEISEITKDFRFDGKRIKIEMEDHEEGCGAQAMTNILIHRLKFITHNLSAADKLAFFNEIHSYFVTNGILAPFFGAVTFGRVSVSAVTKRSEIESTS